MKTAYAPEKEPARQRDDAEGQLLSPRSSSSATFTANSPSHGREDRDEYGERANGCAVDMEDESHGYEAKSGVRDDSRGSGG